MNPEDKVLLKRALELSEENNRILKKMQRTARIAVVWGFIKVLIIVVPIVLGYIYITPRINEWREDVESFKEVLPTINTLTSFKPR